MTTIPQLRDDIKKLQEENRKLKSDLKAEMERPPVIKYVDREVKVVSEPKLIEKHVPGPTKIEYRYIPGEIQYRDNPKHIAMIRKLQGKT